jgi:hypothetical protein
MTDKKSIQITKELADIINTDGYVSSEVADNVFVKVEDGNKYSIAIPLPDSNNAYIIKLHNIIKISVSDDEYMHGDVDLVEVCTGNINIHKEFYRLRTDIRNLYVKNFGNWTNFPSCSICNISIRNPIQPKGPSIIR